jgi:regulatory protein
LRCRRFPLGEPLWHKKGVKAQFKPRRLPQPLNEPALRELALRYAGKYATTRAKLRGYLARKVRERGWNGDKEPDFEALANRFAELGYIDDAGYALGQSRSLSARGYGKQRLTQKLRVAGVADDDSEDAHAHADKEAVSAALRFAERRRRGPFADSPAERPQREKWIGAMVRAGHSFSLARAIAALEPAQDIDLEQLFDRARLTNA